MKLINILYDDELVRYDNVSYVNYVKVEDKNIFNPESIQGPILVVGYSLAKSLYGKDTINPLEKTVIPYQLYWESSFNENSVRYFDGLFKILYKDILNIVFKNLRYENVDPVFLGITKPEDVIRIIGDEYRYLYKYKQMMYVLTDKIYGFDLLSYEYFGITSNSIESIFSDTPKTIDEDAKVYQSYRKIFPHVDFLKRYMVLLVQSAQYQHFSINL